MNRDERRTRAPGLPPARGTVNGVPVLMPRDPDGGGSWISLNSHGHTLAILNRYEDTPHDEGGELLSRGTLVAEMSWFAGAGEAETWLRALELEHYRPFTMVSIGRGHNPVLFESNRRELSITEVSNPGLVRASSGSHQAEAEKARAAVFSALGDRLSGAALMDLHRTHHPSKGPLSICMHRDEAATVSLSHITVNINNLLFRYVFGAPCETVVMSKHSL